MPFVIGILLLLIDQTSKFLAVKYLKPVDSIEIIKDFFILDYVENRGAAFGSFAGHGKLLIAVTGIIIILGIAVYIRLDRTKTVSRVISWAAVVMISGALGNFADRLTRGYVVDMLHFIFWGHSFAVFNFADMLVVSSAFVIAVCMMIYETDKNTEETQ